MSTLGIRSFIVAGTCALLFCVPTGASAGSVLPRARTPASAPAQSSIGGAAAVAHWTFPEGATGSRTILAGVVAYHQSGIGAVGFALDGGPTMYVTRELKNPLSGGECEFLFPVNTRAFADDTRHVLSATAYPLDPQGVPRVLPDRTFYVDNGNANAVWYVDGINGSDISGTGSPAEPFATIKTALLNARGGDRVRVRAGSYDLTADKDLDFDQYVTIEPDGAASVKIVSLSGGTIDTSYLCFNRLDFDWSAAPPTGPDGEISGWMIGAFSSHHLWFQNCIFHGPLNRYNNYLQALRTWGSFRYLLVENCSFFGIDRALGVQNDAIVRRNRFASITSDVLNFTANDVLFTGNHVWNVAPPKVSITSTLAEPYDLSVNRELTLYNWDEAQTSYSATTVADVASMAADASNASVREVAESLMADPGFRALFSATDAGGRLKILVNRTNTKQHLYVSGTANLVLQYTQVSPQTEAQGSGQHADLLQSWTDTQNVIVRNNAVHDCASQFVLLENKVTDFVLVNNLLESNGGPWAITLSAFTHENVLIEFNTVFDSPNALINATGGVPQVNLVVRNNIFGDRAGNTDDTRPGRIWSDNIYDFFGGGITYNLNGASKNVNPARVVPSPLLPFWQGVSFTKLGGEYAGDYHLRAGHPAINAGNRTSGIAYDLDWKPRDSLPDIGCYEY